MNTYLDQLEMGPVAGPALSHVVRDVTAQDARAAAKGYVHARERYHRARLAFEHASDVSGVAAVWLTRKLYERALRNYACAGEKMIRVSLLYPEYFATIEHTL